MIKRHITPERKALFRAGQILAGLGLLSFLSVFVSAALSFGPGSGPTDVRSMAIRAFGGDLPLVMGVGVVLARAIVVIPLR